MQRTGERGANALKQELVVRVEATSGASAEQVYAVLADLSTHTVWAGERQGTKTRLLTIDAPARAGDRRDGVLQHRLRSDGLVRGSLRGHRGPAGADVRVRHGGPLLDEEGATSDWTNVERYELEPLADGCRIVCTGRVTG